MDEPTMPRSSSGVFQAVLRPWVAVKAPPSGGPTSSPKMLVTPWRSSATCSAMRMACTMLLTDEVPLAEDVVEDALRVRHRLLAHPLVRLLHLQRVARAQLVHLRAGQHAALLQSLLEAHQAVGLVVDAVGARGGAVAVQARDHRLE